jgi:HAD superfamily hydrolase (TIGR01509 family)
VLLDVLGTLLGLEPPGPVLAGVLAREHGIALDPAHAARAFAAEMAYYREHHCAGSDPRALADLRRRCALVLAEGLRDGPAAALAIDELERAMLASLRFHAYPDASPALTALRERGIRLVAVSNWDSSLPEVLARVALADRLDGAVASAQVGRPKPAPEIFQAALALARASPGEALHVGDSQAADVVGARALGIAAALLRREGEPAPGAAAEHGPREDVPSGTLVIGSLAELPAIVDRGLAG